jgi:hypothetical protein
MWVCRSSNWRERLRGLAPSVSPSARGRESALWVLAVGARGMTSWAARVKRRIGPNGWFWAQQWDFTFSFMFYFLFSFILNSFEHKFEFEYEFNLWVNYTNPNPSIVITDLYLLIFLQIIYFPLFF